jgi:hypothetical protein
MHDKANRSRPPRRDTQSSGLQATDEDILGRLAALAVALDGASAEAEAVSKRVREILLAEELRYRRAASKRSN